MERVRVIALVVTYNRSMCLERLLEALESQTYPIEMIILVNNKSTDNTYDMLADRGCVDVPLDGNISFKTHNGIKYFYFLNNRNAGGAGGFAKGIELTLNQECDYVWVMDDDVRPEPDCLEKLLAGREKDVIAIVPNRTDENCTDVVSLDIDLKSIFKFDMPRRQKRLKAPFAEPFYYVRGFTFEGPLIAHDVIKKVGLPYADFVILCDDLDYAMRVNQYGKIKFITGATMHRQLATREKEKNWRFTWKSYYHIRNNILMQKKYCKTFGAKYISPVIAWNWWFLLLIHKRRIKDFPLLCRSIRDGMHGVHGITVEPGEF